VGEGEKGTNGLALGGTSWPSGARPTQPSQTVQVAGLKAAFGTLGQGGAEVVAAVEAEAMENAMH
jgi:hypothetical protein